MSALSTHAALLTTLHLPERGLLTLLQVPQSSDGPQHSGHTKQRLETPRTWWARDGEPWGEALAVQGRFYAHALGPDPCR